MSISTLMHCPACRKECCVDTMREHFFEWYCDPGDDVPGCGETYLIRVQFVPTVLITPLDVKRRVRVMGP